MQTQKQKSRASSKQHTYTGPRNSATEMGEIAPIAMKMGEMGEKGIKWSSGAQSVGQWVVQDQKNDARGHLFYEKTGVWSSRNIHGWNRC